MPALRGLAFALAGFVSGGACGLGLAAVLINLLDRSGMIDHGADGLSGVVLFFGLGAAMALGGGIVAAILVPRRARSAGPGSALLWVGAMLTVAAACYLLLTGLLTSVAEVETIGGTDGLHWGNRTQVAEIEKSPLALKFLELFAADRA